MFLNVKKLWTLLKPKWRYMHASHYQCFSFSVSWPCAKYVAAATWAGEGFWKGSSHFPPPPHPPENLSPTRLKSSRGRKKARLAALIKRPARRLLRKVSCTCKVRRRISIAGSCVQTSKQNFFSFPCTYHSGRIFRTNRSSKPVVYVWQNFTLSNVKSDLRNLKPLSYKSYCFL